jgi:hypothetical protein
MQNIWRGLMEKRRAEEENDEEEFGHQHRPPQVGYLLLWFGFAGVLYAKFDFVLDVNAIFTHRFRLHLFYLSITCYGPTT